MINSPQQNYKFLTARQVAERLNLSIRSIYRLIEDGQIPSYSPTPRTYRIAEADFLDYLEQIKN